VIKVVYAFRRRRDLSPEEFFTYWNDVHGPLGARLPGLRRLVQSHTVTLPSDLRAGDPVPGGSGSRPRAAGTGDYDGIAELWFDDEEALARARRSPEWRAATADEVNFIEPGSESYAVTAEHEVVIPTTTSGFARLVVLAVIENAAGEILLCRMTPRRPFAGQWALPGGGVEPGERVEEAIRREAREELGLPLRDPTPRFFVEGRHEKVLPDGTRIQRHMIFLVFQAMAGSQEVRLNPEFDAFAWVAPEQLASYAVNPTTRTVLRRLGLLPA
jgi:nucleoside triphosphatase